MTKSIFGNSTLVSTIPIRRLRIEFFDLFFLIQGLLSIDLKWKAITGVFYAVFYRLFSQLRVRLCRRNRCFFCFIIIRYIRIFLFRCEALGKHGWARPPFSRSAVRHSRIRGTHQRRHILRSRAEDDGPTGPGDFLRRGHSGNLQESNVSNKNGRFQFRTQKKKLFPTLFSTCRFTNFILKYSVAGAPLTSNKSCSALFEYFLYE